MPERSVLTPADLDALCDIEQRAYAVPWTSGNLKDSLDGNHLGLAYRLDGKIVGYAFMMQVLDEMHLLNLTIDPLFQRRGWGRRLLEDVKSMARDRGCSHLFLEVRHGNERALKLYRDSGFAMIGLRPHYYPGPRGREDAIVMRAGL